MCLILQGNIDIAFAGVMDVAYFAVNFGLHLVDQLNEVFEVELGGDEEQIDNAGVAALGVVAR